MTKFNLNEKVYFIALYGQMDFEFEAKDIYCPICNGECDIEFNGYKLECPVHNNLFVPTNKSHKIVGISLGENNLMSDINSYAFKHELEYGSKWISEQYCFRTYEEAVLACNRFNKKYLNERKINKNF